MKASGRSRSTTKAVVVHAPVVQPTEPEFRPVAAARLPSWVIREQPTKVTLDLPELRHVVPADADPPHDLTGACWCQPVYEDVIGSPGGRIFIHRRSLDSPHIEVDGETA